MNRRSILYLIGVADVIYVVVVISVAVWRGAALLLILGHVMRGVLGILPPLALLVGLRVLLLVLLIVWRAGVLHLVVLEGMIVVWVILMILLGIMVLRELLILGIAHLLVL